MLDPKVQSLLDSLRARIRRYIVWDSLLAILAIVLAAFWIGLLIDYVPVLLGGREMPRSARGVLLMVVGVTLLVVLGRLMFSRLSRPLPDDSLALLLERQHRSLGGRLVTAVQLSEPDRQGDTHSEELLDLVRKEATVEVDNVDPGRVLRSDPLWRKALVVGPLLFLMLLFAVVSPSAFATAAARLTLLSDAKWPRRARLEMVGIDLQVVTASSSSGAGDLMERIEFERQTVRLPIGSSPTLRIRADSKDFQVPTVCTLYYETDSGTRGQSNFRRVGRERDGFQSFVMDGPPLDNLGESFTFSVQGLDDRLTEFRVEAIQPPAITKMKVKVRYPNYLRDAEDNSDETSFDFETSYQAGLRISEGSAVTLEASVSQPVGSVDSILEFSGTERSVDKIAIAEDGRSFSLRLDDFRRPTAIRFVPSDLDGISSQAPFRYFVGAIVDEPPSVSLELNGIQSAVTPIAMLPLECIVKDDYGVESLTAMLVRNSSNEVDESDPKEEDEISGGINPEVPNSEIFSKAMSPDRSGKVSQLIDLRELTNSQTIEPLQPGNAISLFAEAKDRFDLEGTHLSTSDIFRLQIVSPEELLTLLERRELGLRTRLEQTVTETKGLRDQLARFKADGFEPVDPNDAASGDEQDLVRMLQVLKLRIGQSGLQASKTSQELVGIAESLDDLLREMVNNRIDSQDRQERLGSGVRDPLRRVVEGPMRRLMESIKSMETTVEDPKAAAKNADIAVKEADQVLLALTAVLEKMLDLESYNELLDLVRGLIQDQQKLQEETKAERKKAIKSLFE